MDLSWYYLTLVFKFFLIIYGSDIEIVNNNQMGNPEESGLYFEGDIKLTERNGVSSHKAKWPNGIIPYRLNGNFSKYERNLLQRAIQDYHNKTCVRFRKSTAVDRDYLIITNKARGCWSNVGRIGDGQQMNLESKECFRYYGTILHELMHVLGFHHEQNRYERDNFVRVIKENIIPDKLNNFDKLLANAANSYGVPYDYASIMHYSPRSFSRNGKVTLKALKCSGEAKRMGQRDDFSMKDLLKINKMYSCL